MKYFLSYFCSILFSSLECSVGLGLLKTFLLPYINCNSYREPFWQEMRRIYEKSMKRACKLIYVDMKFFSVESN